MNPNTSPIAGSDLPFDALARQALDHLLHGGVAGDLLDMGPAEYEAMYAIGHQLYVSGRYADAVDMFSHLTMHNHHERRYFMAYGAALQMSGDCASAITVYTLVSLMDLRDPLPAFHTCECLIQLGMKQEAREGLAMVIHQCDDGHAETRDRARALLALLSAQHTGNPPESKQ